MCWAALVTLLNHAHNTCARMISQEKKDGGRAQTAELSGIRTRAESQTETRKPQTQGNKRPGNTKDGVMNMKLRAMRENEPQGERGPLSNGPVRTSIWKNGQAHLAIVVA